MRVTADFMPTLGLLARIRYGDRRRQAHRQDDHGRDDVERHARLPEPVDAASDVYSLGCVAFELLKTCQMCTAEEHWMAWLILTVLALFAGLDLSLGASLGTGVRLDGFTELRRT